MDWHSWLSLALTGGALLVLIFSKLAPHIIMMAVLTILSVCGVLTASEALAGFSNPGLITVAAMFVVAVGLHASGGMELIVNKILGRPKSERTALARLFTPVVVMSAFLNNTAVVATMIPAVNAWARKIAIAPSKLMIPLSYAAILGGTLTLIGTSTNLIVNSQYQEITGDAGFSLFAITAVGLPVTIFGLIFIWVFFPRWLPLIGEEKAFANLREFTLEVKVALDGPLPGKSISESGLLDIKRVYLVEIERQGAIFSPVSPQEILQGGERLIFAGDTEAISDLLRINGIVPSTESDHPEIFSRDRAGRKLVEAVVSPHCDAIGYAIRDSRFTNRYGAVVLAVARNGERIKGNLGSIRLRAGDTLLVEALPVFISRQRYNKEFLLISELNSEPPRHELAYLAWGILIAMVTVASFGLLSILNAALIAAGLMLATGCCSVAQAEKSLDLTVLITIAASFSLGVALQKTGVTDFLAENMIHISAGIPWLMLVMVYVLVSTLTELITNNAAAVLTLPLVLKITEQAHLNAEPFVFAIMMAASASFATPLGYQTNIMVYGPGGYRFSDFIKVGLPMNFFIGLITILVLLLGWPLSR